MLPSLVICSRVLAAIGPSFSAISVLKIVPPLAVVHRPVHVSVHAESVGFVIGPVPFVDVAVHVDKASLAMRFVLLPVADVLGSIAPLLRAVAIAETTFPLASVFRARGKSVSRSLLALGVRIVNAGVGNGLPRLVESEIF